MTQLVDIETALLHRLSMLRAGAAGAFKTIDGLAGHGMTRLMEHLQRQRKPSLVVRYAGRKATSSHARPQLLLYMAVEGARGNDEARVGGEGVSGMHALLDLVRGDLDGTMLLCGVRLTFVGEAPVADDDRWLVFQQTYDVQESA
jgi:hypothetical protein